MRPIATDVTRSVVSVSVCWSRGCIVQNGWTDRDAVWEMILVGPRMSDRTNPFAAANGDKSSMRPFAELLWAHVNSFCENLQQNIS